MACHAKSDTGYMRQEQEMMQNTQKTCQFVQKRFREKLKKRKEIAKRYCVNTQTQIDPI